MWPPERARSGLGAKNIMKKAKCLLFGGERAVGAGVRFENKRQRRLPLVFLWLPNGLWV
jgi:hypothetical protein